MSVATLHGSLVLAVAVALGGCSCAQSHVADGGPVDGGVDGRDVAPPDGALIDSGCDEVAGFRLCDSCGGCTAETGRCLSSLDVCSRGYPQGDFDRGDNCDFSARQGSYCWTGLPCAAALPLGMCSRDTVTDEPYPFCGPCMPPEFCVAAREREGDLPPFQCTWSDGTEVVTGPPAGECPVSPDPTYPFCGGACGLVVCPSDGSGTEAGSCVGVSDTRSFGVCMPISQGRCDESDLLTTEQNLTFCGGVLHTECACLVPSPLPEGTTSRFGFIVTRAACLGYRDHFPDNADCVDRSWTSIR